MNSKQITSWKVVIPSGIILWVVGTVLLSKGSQAGNIQPISSTSEALYTGLAIGGFIIFIIGIINLVRYIKNKKKGS